jgi:uncharacterized protein (TIGR04141 family)
MSETEDKIKQVLTLYKIDTSLFEEGSANEIVEKIFSEPKGYEKETKIKEELHNGFRVIMYYAHKHSSYEKWKGFFEDVLGEDSDTFTQDSNDDSGEKYPFNGSYLSFVCFFIKNEESIFALCMGKGYLMIDRYIENDFGFGVLARLLKPESNFLRSATANHLSGATFEDASFFRFSESFLSQDDFGKIFREAITQLDKESLTKIGLEEEDIDKVNCLAKSSFTLKSSVSFEKLVSNILPKLLELWTHTPNFEINKVALIGKKHHLYEELDKILCERIRTNFLDFDFFSPDETLQFFTAESYSVSKGGNKEKIERHQDDLTDVVNLEKTLRTGQFLDFTDPISFPADVQSIYVNAYDDGDHSVLRKSFSIKRGLHGELEHNGEKFFWMNGKFWQVDAKFLTSFSDRVFSRISNEMYIAEDNIPFLEFDLTNNQTEANYNSSHASVKDFVCVDKKTPKGVELCDLIYSTENTTYLVHVKKGFERNVRDLTSQILTAARFIHEETNGNSKQYLKSVRSHGAGEDIKSQMSEQEFLNLFEHKNIVFVFAVASQGDIFDKNSFTAMRSSIAKLEVFELLRDFTKFIPPFGIKIAKLPTK